MDRRLSALVLVVAVVVCVSIRGVAGGQCVVDRLAAADATEFTEFGSAVAIDGDLAVVGAWNDDELGSDAGAAYVFRFDGSHWVEEAKLVASDGVANDLFGHTVAVDGDVIVVGGYAGVQIGIVNGAAYVYRFDGGGWNEEAILSSSTPILTDYYGYSVAVSGGRIAVGDPGNSIFSSPPGQIFIYDYDGSDWIETSILSASDGALNDGFGWSLSLRGDRLAAGAPTRQAAGIDRGGLYLFEYDGLSWSESILDSDESADHDRLGTAVSIGADRVVATATQVDGSTPVGPGKVVVFFRFGASFWLEEPTLTSASIRSGGGFGSSAALFEDELLVGAPTSGPSGRVAHFSFDGLEWTESVGFVPEQAGIADRIGFAVAIDASRFLIAAPRHDNPVVNAGACFAYDLEFVATNFLRGDSNGDGSVDVGDAVWLLGYIFQSGSPPPCLRGADANGDSLVDLGDAIFVINYNFLDGPAPSAPFPSCGVAAAASPLCCLESSCP